MAKWVVYMNSRACFTMLYRNLVNGAVYACGDLRLDTPMNMIVDWVMHQQAAQPGDLIKLPNGTTLQVLNDPKARA